METEDIRVYKKVLAGPYIGNQLTQDATQRWSPYSAILIDAPTGSGKNTFVRNVLAPLLNNREAMLVVTNRRALDRQQKVELLGAQIGTLEEFKEMPPDGLLRIDQTFFCTYQSLHVLFRFMNSLSTYTHLIPTLQIPYFRFVVLDEAHFFTSDALFNPYTGSLLNHVIATFCNSIRIYMTATPDDVIEPLVTWETQWRKGHPPLAHPKIAFFSDANGHYRLTRPVTQYSMEPVERKYQVSYFNDLQTDICKNIIKDTTDDQWLIFVQRKKEATQLASRLNDHNISVASLDAAKKTSHIWDEIVNHGVFSQKVLISTKVLENGVNLTSPTLKHIVVTSSDKVELLQMIGRKRTSANEAVHIYVQNLSADRLKSCQERVTNALNTISTWQRSPLVVLKDYWRNWGNPRYSFSRLFYVKSVDTEEQPGSGTLVLNSLARYKLHIQAAFYSQFNEEHVVQQFQSLVNAWLHTSIAVGHCQDEKSTAPLISYIREHLNQPIPSGLLHSEFAERLFHLLRQHMPELRADMAHRKAAINQGMQNLKLPYVLKSEKGNWIIREKTHKCNN